MDKQPLNLPPCSLRLSERDGRTTVWDILRNRWIVLTPEEWVRQHFVHYLTEHKGYPASMLGNEISLTLGATTKRCDTVLYDTSAQARMIIEYKAPHIDITQKVFNQICRYNIVLRVKYLIVSNGMQHFCCHVDYESGKCTFLKEIPDYDALQ